MKARPLFTLLLCLSCVGACGPSATQQVAARSAQDTRSRSLAGTTQHHGDSNRCDASAPNREVSEYDTNGDNVPDVRKVFERRGTGTDSVLVLVCREADLNGDGTKDVVRYYDNDGHPLREEADRNFDGRMDELTVFENGEILRQELDTNGNGKVDTKIFYQHGEPIRAERDMTGRSTASNWHPDRWEYYEHGRLVRMGTDVNGDGVVDRWDRNQVLSHQFAAQDAEQNDGAGEAGTASAGDGGVDGGASAAASGAGGADAGASAGG